MLASWASHSIEFLNKDKMNRANPEISIIVPLYNEEEIWDKLVARLTTLIESFPHSLEVVMVDDGSRDGTPDKMRDLALTNHHFQAVFLSRNFGHQLALTAGLSMARATQAVMIIDGDLQDPPELLDEFFEKFQEGYDIVYAIRKTRKESILKRFAYSLFYRSLRQLANIDIPLDSGDFCLLSRAVVDCLNNMPEESRFIRGMRSWIGFRQIGVPYDRSERAAGEPKYSLKMLLQLASNGFFNFSEIPVRMASLTGLAVIMVAALYAAWSLFALVFYGTSPRGFTGLLLTMLLFSGTQLLFLGIIGEYVLRIFFQVKQRPLFLVREKILDGKCEGPHGWSNRAD
jgi:dolichol-phosphate mannosyltransferase